MKEGRRESRKRDRGRKGCQGGKGGRMEEEGKEK